MKKNERMKNNGRIPEETILFLLVYDEFTVDSDVEKGLNWVSQLTHMNLSKFHENTTEKISSKYTTDILRHTNFLIQSIF